MISVWQGKRRVLRWPGALGVLKQMLMTAAVGVGGLFGMVEEAGGAEIRGKVIDGASGSGMRRILVRAFAHGQSTASGAQTEGDGSYVLLDVPPGLYAVCVAADDRHRPASAPVVEVAEAKPAEVNLQVGQALAIEGDAWLQPHPSFYQSFRASGLGLTTVGVKAFGSKRRVMIQLLEGDGPEGAAVGPARETGPVGGEGTEVVRWSGGEVPIVPGRRYTLKMSAAGGERWVPGVAGRGNVYPLGSAYFDGSPRPYSDLGVLICEDNDGLRTSYAVSGGWRTHRARSMGQTFKALSRNVTFASAVLSGVTGPPVYARFSIHQGGPGGTQIGPSKGVQVGEAAAVAWGPDEVPVTPGETYYLHIESFGGLRFLAGVQPDSYADGQAVFDGRPTRDRDLCAMVAGRISDADFVRLVAHPQQREVIPLANGSFEDGDTGWHYHKGDAGAAVGCDAGVVPMWGVRMFGWTNEKAGEGSRPTVYQHVKVSEGERYCFSGSVYTNHIGGRSSDVKVRLVVAPGGGTDLRNYDVIQSSQWYATEGQWRRGSVEFTAGAETVTVGFELEQRFNLDRSSLYVDGALLERIGAR